MDSPNGEHARREPESNDDAAGLSDAAVLGEGGAQGFSDHMVFRCPHCDAVQGTTNGRELTAGAVIILSQVELTCVACRTLYTWRPEPAYVE